ncbi:MAG: hypothetical protein HW421_4092 [Ignavibacteria bacterium]|nr:hypothetical protein [Ignavibacteria bacterium]
MLVRNHYELSSPIYSIEDSLKEKPLPQSGEIGYLERFYPTLNIGLEGSINFEKLIIEPFFMIKFVRRELIEHDLQLFETIYLGLDVKF